MQFCRNFFSQKLSEEVGEGTAGIALTPPELKCIDLVQHIEPWRLEKECLAIEEERLFVAEKLEYQP